MTEVPGLTVMESNVATVVLDRLREGKGAEVILMDRKKPKRIVLIPSPLYSLNPSLEILIAGEGHGAYFYDGKTPLNKFQLITAGYPIDIATEVAWLVGQIMQEAKAKQSTTLPSEQPNLQLAN